MVTVNFISREEGEIKKFLDMYFKGNSTIDHDVMEWIYVYRKFDDAEKILKAFIHKYNKYNISLWVQVDDEDLIPIKKKNFNKVINQIKEKSFA